MRKITNEELNRPSAGEFAAMEKMPVAVAVSYTHLSAGANRAADRPEAKSGRGSAIRGATGAGIRCTGSEMCIRDRDDTE